MFRNKNISIYVLMAFIVSFTYASGPMPSEHLTRASVVISPDKTTLLPYEHIGINFTITSRVDFIMHVSNYHSANEQFIITDESGKVHGCCMSGFYACGDSLLPHQSFSGRTDIRDSYMLTDPGRYTCQLVFYGWPSNEVKIDIIEPQGELREALLLYDHARDLCYGTGGSDSLTEKDAFYLFLIIVDDYTNTIYAVPALRLAFSLYGLADDQTIRDKCKEYIDRGLTGELLEICLSAYSYKSVNLDDRAGGEEYLQSLIAQNRTPELTEKASKWLEKVRTMPDRKARPGRKGNNE